jgi:transposase
MLGSTRNIHVYALAEPCDLRKGYDGLYALTRDVLEQDPLSGHAFLFVSRNCKRAKVLHYDGTGLCIYMKRLEEGCFVAPWDRTDDTSIHFTISELALFLEGSKAVRKNLSPKVFKP